MNCPTSCPVCTMPTTVNENYGINCYCQGQLTFRVLLKEDSTIDNYSVFIWLPYDDVKKKWHRMTFFWRQLDNYWQINLYLDKWQSLATGCAEINPQEGWKILQRTRKLLVFL